MFVSGVEELLAREGDGSIRVAGYRRDRRAISGDFFPPIADAFEGASETGSVNQARCRRRIRV